MNPIVSSRVALSKMSLGSYIFLALFHSISATEVSVTRSAILSDAVVTSGSHDLHLAPDHSTISYMGRFKSVACPPSQAVSVSSEPSPAGFGLSGSSSESPPGRVRNETNPHNDVGLRQSSCRKHFTWAASQIVLTLDQASPAVQANPVLTKSVFSITALLGSANTGGDRFEKGME